MTDNVLTTKTAIATIKDCRALLADYASTMKQVNLAGKQPNDAPSIMFQRAYDFGLSTIDAIIKLLGDDEKYALQACALCRPFYETAVRLHWASRASDGWQRLQVLYANEERKWAEAALKISPMPGQKETTPSLAQVAASTAGHRKQIVDQTNASGKKFDPAQGMEQLLNEIDKHDMNQGIREESEKIGGYYYTNLYRILCKAAHGHVSSLARPSGHLRHATFGTVLATSSLLQAHCHRFEEDARSAIENVGQTLKEIVENCRA